MTIGMLIECLGGKTFSLKGDKPVFDSFERCEFRDIGKILKGYGFNSMGTDYLYSGIYGIPLQAEIF